MLDDLHAETFAAHMHPEFRTDLSSAQAIALELVQVKDGPHRARHRQRQPPARSVSRSCFAARMIGCSNKGCIASGMTT